MNYQGAIVMDEDFNAQGDESQQSEIYKIYRALVHLYPRNGGVGWDWWNLVSRLSRRRWSKRLEVLLKRQIERKATELKEDEATRSRSILSLSLQGIEMLDDELIAQTSDQLKSFLFAGYDTTSIVLQWVFYELSRTPHALQAVRNEVTEIFGPDTSPAALWDMLVSRGDELIGKMSYTTAVIKEVLRLHPPSGSARYTPRGTGFNVSLLDGEKVCLDGMIVYNCETLIHRDEAVYGTTKDAFVPERWLGNIDTGMQFSNKAELKGAQIPPSAWRPFERGPRNCIGQELANLEVRVILACTIRRYNFTKVGLGEIVRDSDGKPVMGSNNQYALKSELFNVSGLI
jgi:cytochrome P450